MQEPASAHPSERRASTMLEVVLAGIAELHTESVAGHRTLVIFKAAGFA